LAQDIQKVLPELVQTDENGMMSIDYIGFIPLIVESIKEMQQTIQQQNEVIDNLQALLSPEVQSQLRSNTTSTSNISAVDGAKRCELADPQEKGKSKQATVTEKLPRNL
jgi:uncharacterized protein (DUF342 family)